MSYNAEDFLETVGREISLRSQRALKKEDHTIAYATHVVYIGPKH